MLEVEDDIFAYVPHAWVVIPTNIGWSEAGVNVMGAGLAKQAAARWPGLPVWYGALCKQFGARTPVVANAEYGCVLFPTKPLDANEPHLSWKQPSSLHLIEEGLAQLVGLPVEGDVMVPLLGCGMGRLPESAVLPLMRKYLEADRFILVRQPKRNDDYPF